MKARNHILYQEIFDALRSDLISGTYAVGSLFPTETELESRFGVSKITVRKAVELLVEGGYLLKQSGVGTTVLSDQPINVFNKAKTYTNILNDHGVKVQNTVVYVGQSSNDTINQKFASENIYEIHRIYTLDGLSSIFVKHYFSLINHEGLPKEKCSNFSFYKFLVSQGFEISHIEDAFCALKTPLWLKKSLPALSEVALKRTRSSFDNKGKLVEYTASYYDSDKTPYLIDYQV